MTLERIGRTLGTVLKLAVALFVVAVVALAVAHAVPSVVGASGSYVVTSGSMSPTIQTGDVIFVYETEPANLEQGDIVAFDGAAGDNDIVTHRIVEVVRDEDGVGYVTKGDANEDPDPGVVRPGQVVGTVPTPSGIPARIPLFGHVLVFAGTQWGIILMVFIPVGLLIGSELYTLGRALLASRSASGGNGTDRADGAATESTTADATDYAETTEDA